MCFAESAWDTDIRDVVDDSTVTYGVSITPLEERIAHEFADRYPGAMVLLPISTPMGAIEEANVTGWWIEADERNLGYNVLALFGLANWLTWNKWMGWTGIRLTPPAETRALVCSNAVARAMNRTGRIYVDPDTVIPSDVVEWRCFLNPRPITQ